MMVLAAVATLRWVTGVNTLDQITGIIHMYSSHGVISEAFTGLKGFNSLSRPYKCYDCYKQVGR